MASALFLIVSPDGTIGVVAVEPKEADLDSGELVHPVVLGEDAQNALEIGELLGRIYSDPEPFGSLLEAVAQKAFELGRQA